MTKYEMVAYATMIDRVVSSLCDTIEFETGDATDKDLNDLVSLATALREAARSEE